MYFLEFALIPIFVSCQPAALPHHLQKTKTVTRLIILLQNRIPTMRSLSYSRHRSKRNHPSVLRHTLQPLPTGAFAHFPRRVPITASSPLYGAQSTTQGTEVHPEEEVEKRMKKRKMKKKKRKHLQRSLQ